MRDISIIPTVRKQLAEVLDLCNSVEYLKEFLADQNVDKEERHTIIDIMTIGLQLNKAVRDFLHVLVERHMFMEIESFCRIYDEMADSAENKIQVFVRSASPLTKEQRGALVRKFEKKTGCEVLLHEEVAEELLCGLQVSVGNKIYDYSLVDRVNSMDENLHRS